MVDRLKGKVALVTGANAGIGLAIANLFAREGAVVVGTGRRLEKGVEAFDNAEFLNSQNSEFLQQDVSDEQRWPEVITATIEKFGQLDILVNNAGIGGPSGVIDEIDLRDWQRLININLNGPFLGAKYTFKQFKAQKTGGNVINMASVASFKPVPQAAAYSTSKGGLTMLTKELAVEGAPFGIRVNSIHPGWIDTDIVPASLKEHEAQMQVFDHFGKPDDIAEMAIYLASDESKNVTGAQFLNDGGNMLQ